MRPGEWLKETIVPGFLPAIAGGAAWLTLQWTVKPSSWSTLAGCTLGGWAIYGLLLGRFGLRAADRSDLHRVLEAQLLLNLALNVDTRELTDDLFDARTPDLGTNGDARLADRFDHGSERAQRSAGSSVSAH